ncbi:hypothetical protein AC1031_010988 [Aphanomyces cochlioides]|nr:hypothetical protein AC1031_010988 [Aphanomyces cochlioides]
MATQTCQALLDIIARLRDQLRATARAVLSLVHENQQLEQQVHTLKGQLDKAQEDIQHTTMEIEIWHEFRDSSNQEITTAHKHIHALETQAQLDRAAWHAKEQSLLDRIQVLQMELHISKAKPTETSNRWQFRATDKRRSLRGNISGNSPPGESRQTNGATLLTPHDV